MSQILADPELAPFFEHTDVEHLKHKQEVMMDVIFGGLQVRPLPMAWLWCYVGPWEVARSLEHKLGS